MAGKIHRREAIVRGLGAAAAASGLPRLLGAEQPAEPKRQAPASPVAVQRCDSYRPEQFRRALDKSLDLIGGIDRLVRGKTVTVKINLTGLSWKPVFGLPAQETYQTQPATLAALCAALADAGAKRIVVIENLYWDRPFEKILLDEGWDVKRIQSAGDHRVAFEDTRNLGSFKQYSRFKVPWGGYIYPAFDLNGRFEKTDVLVSLAKLKQHACAGITCAVKNFFGNTPCALYGNDAPNENSLIHRTDMFHAGRKQPPAGVPGELPNDVAKNGTQRVPHVTADIYGARPADLAIVDGIRTISGGEGHWNRGIALVEPKLLIVGRNGVSTDAVCTAAMGFDPLAPHGEFPFQGPNHLRLLADKGQGEIDPEKIEVVGLPLKEAVHPFRPAGAGA